MARSQSQSSIRVISIRKVGLNVTPPLGKSSGTPRKVVGTALGSPRNNVGKPRNPLGKASENPWKSAERPSASHRETLGKTENHTGNKVKKDLIAKKTLLYKRGRVRGLVPTRLLTVTHFLTDTMKRTRDDYFTESDEELDQALVRCLNRTEQIGGALGPLFQFDLAQIGPRRRWRQTTGHMQFHTTLQQERDPVPTGQHWCPTDRGTIFRHVPRRI